MADRQNVETLAASDLLAPQRPLERDLSDFECGREWPCPTIEAVEGTR